MVARVIVDADGTVVFADRVAADLYDTSTFDVVGRRMEDVAGPHWLGLPDSGAACDAVASTGTWTGHVTHRTRAGLLPVVVTARHVVDRSAGGPGMHLTIEVHDDDAVAGGRTGAVREEIAVLMGTESFPSLLSLVGWLLAARTAEEIGGAVLGTVVDTMGATGGHLAVTDLDGSAAFVTVIGYSPGTMARWGTVDLGLDTPMRTALTEGRAVYVTDRAERDRTYPLLREVDEPTQALCSIPLLVGSRITGALSVSFPDPRRFADEERAFLNVVAHITALALAGTDPGHRTIPARSGAVVELTWTDGVDLGHMRSALRLQLEGGGYATHDAALCATELVTNAVEHGAWPVHARFELIGSRLRVEVSDCATELPRLRAPGPEGGFGLRIVETVAERWGTALTPWGKTTWADLALQPAG